MLKDELYYGSDTIDIYGIQDSMSSRGWHLNALQNPPGIHVAVTLPIVNSVEEMLKDLREVVAEVADAEQKARAEGKSNVAKGDATALYGVAGSLPDKGVVTEIAKTFLDTLYKV